MKKSLSKAEFEKSKFTSLLQFEGSKKSQMMKKDNFAIKKKIQAQQADNLERYITPKVTSQNIQEQSQLHTDKSENKLKEISVANVEHSRLATGSPDNKKGNRHLTICPELDKKSPFANLVKKAIVTQNNPSDSTLAIPKINLFPPDSTNSQAVKRQPPEVGKATVVIPSDRKGSLPTRQNLISHAAGLQGNRSSNLRVCIRFRPLNEVETELIKSGVGGICVNFPANNNHSVILKQESSQNEIPFTFDRVFNCDSPQEEVYNTIGKETIEDVTTGYNGTIFAYGQSGSGKTYTMYGEELDDEVSCGIVPRMISELFEYVNTSDENVTFQFKLSVMQIYKEVIYDLLTGDRDLKIKENPIRGIYVDGITEVCISTYENFMNYVELSQANRIVSGTKLNQYSSRSHSILILEVTQTFLNENITKKGTLNLVDLAGSEKISKTGAVGETLEEAKKINLSLSALGNVIHSLTSAADHIPYRDSKLTRILQESLGGNYKTSLIVTCSPHSYHYEETASSLKFAQRAKSIKNKVKVNIKLSYEELQKIINTLRNELQTANQEIIRLKALVPSIGGFTPIDVEARTYDKPIEDEAIKLLNEVEPPRPNITANEICKVNETETDCAVHREKIEELTAKIERMQADIREKDDVITRLEEEVKKAKEGRKKVSLMREETSCNQWDGQNDLKKLIQLYEEIKEKLITIETMQKNAKAYSDQRFLFQEKSPVMIQDLYNLLERSYKNNFDNSSNGRDYLVDNVNNLLLQTFGYYCKNKDEECYEAMADDIKTKFEEMFNGILLENPNCRKLELNGFSNILADDNNQLEVKLKLAKMSVCFTFGLLIYYFNIQLLGQISSKLAKENKSLMDMNGLLVNLLEDALRSNQEVSQNYHGQLKQANALKASLVENGIGRRESLKDVIPNDGALFVNVNSTEPERMKPFRRSSRRILTIISKKNLNLMKNLKDLQTIEPYAASFINLINYNQNDGSAVATDSNPNGTEMNNNTNMPNTNTNTNTILKFNESFPKGNQIENASTSQKKSVTSALFQKKIDKKISKLSMLRGFLVRSIKENENYKQALTLLKEDFYKVTSNTEKMIIEKLMERDYVNYNFNERGSQLMNSKERDINFETEDYVGDKYNCHIPTLPIAECDNNLYNSQRNFRTLPNERDMPLSFEDIGGMRMTIDSDRKFYDEKIQSLQKCHIARKKYTSVSTDVLIERSLIERKEKKIEDYISEYLEGGTVTRKFDGISIKYINNRVKCVYSGGLNAKTVIPSIALNSHIASAVGDEMTSIRSIDNSRENESDQSSGE